MGKARQENRNGIMFIHITYTKYQIEIITCDNMVICNDLNVYSILSLLIV